MNTEDLQKAFKVNASEYRREILEYLYKTDYGSQSKITSTLDHLVQPHISRMIKDLEQRELIHCMNPDDKKGKVYQITEQGKRVQKIINDINMDYDEDY